MIFLLLFPCPGLHAVSLPLSRLRLCLLLGLQLEPPVVTQPGQAAITPVAVLADSFGARGTFGEEEVSWDCLMWPGTTSAGGCSAAGIGPLPGVLWWQPRECWLACSACCQHLPAPPLQGTDSVSHHTES